MRRRQKQSGFAVLEFTLSSIPLLFILISLISMSIGMWEYHTLVEAVNVTARAASYHGAGCVGQTCATTVDQIVHTLATRAVGLSAGSLNATFTSSASTVNCNPVNSCFGNSANWPSLTGNTAITTDITVKATYSFTNPILVFVPGKGTQNVNSVTFGANSRQPVVY